MICQNILPTEFLVGCKYLQGNRSPNNAEREATGYSRAWLHHKGRNKHHYEYWIDYSVTPGEGMVGLKAASVRGRDVHGSYCSFKDLPGRSIQKLASIGILRKGCGKTWKNDSSGYGKTFA